MSKWHWKDDDEFAEAQSIDFTPLKKPVKSGMKVKRQ
jgi:hypothetical protein